MYLAPDGDEVAIANAAAEYLADTLAISRLHHHNTADLAPDNRRSLAEMGWFALALPESIGGSGLSSVEHSLFFREVGRQCGPIDILTQCLAAMATVQDTDLAARFINGDIGVMLMADDVDGQVRLIGHQQAEFALSISRESAQLYQLSSDILQSRPSLDPANSMAVMNAAELQPVVTSHDSNIWRMGSLGTTAMLVGMAEASLDLIVEYAKIRETFGRKIGSYQAVRHSCADMALRAEAARSQLWYAAAALKEGRVDADFHLDTAKLQAHHAAMCNADANIQLHGGIGVTDEHDAHLFLKHSLLLTRLFGSKKSLLSRVLGARLDN